MDRTCPMCNTPMIERSTEHVCPRNDIGDCSYDPNAYEFNSEQERRTDREYKHPQ